MKSLLLLALAILPLSTVTSTAAYAAPEIGKPAPEFMANDVNGDHGKFRINCAASAVNSDCRCA